MSSGNEIDNECPVCFYNIESNDYIETECCSNKIHIHCLIDWYILNDNNTLCFICNQSNPFIQDLSTYGVVFNENSRRTIRNNQINPTNNLNLQNPPNTPNQTTSNNSVIDIEFNDLELNYIRRNNSSRRLIAIRNQIVFNIVPFTITAISCMVFLSCLIVLSIYYF